jgi:hypothetical protein
VFRSLASNGLGVLTQDSESERISEDAPLFQDLMGSAVGGCGQGRSTWFSRLHN